MKDKTYRFPSKETARSLKTSKGILVICLCIAMLQIAGCATIPVSKNPIATDRAQQAGPEKQWGIEIKGIWQTAAGHMLDFRYRVTDPDKAAGLFDRGTKPYLIHQATGKALSVPVTAKIGPLRTTNRPQVDRTYWMFFGNSAGLAKAGDRVTVVIGDFRAENMTVQ